jgi:hypothetical protein
MSNLEDLTEYGSYSSRYSSGRAHTPLREFYAKMTPEKMEEVLEAKIPRAPSVIDRVKSRFGMEINPPYDPREVHIARLITQSKRAHNKKLQEWEEDAWRKQMAEDAWRKQMAEDARVAATDLLQRDYHETRSNVLRAAEAARKNKEQLPNPITDQHIRNAQGNYADLRVAADKSATTDAFVPDRHAYDVISTQRDGAQQDLMALKARHAAQSQQAHNRKVQAWLNRVDQRNRYGGGKSKRVKSKRNKRTKRRNARK